MKTMADKTEAQSTSGKVEAGGTLPRSLGERIAEMLNHSHL